MLTISHGMRLFDIVRIKEEAAGCFSYIMEPVGAVPFWYLPGQFLTFIVHINQRSERRSYSISASLDGGKRFQVTVKKVDNGAVSRDIIAHWKTGLRVQALDPAGRFVLPEKILDNDQFVFVAAGSGITPVFALLQSLIGGSAPVSMLLLTQFRTGRDIIFRETLNEWKIRVRGLEWISFLSRPAGPGISAERLNNEKLEELLLARPALNIRSARYYICGPLSFMRMAAFTLREMGVQEENIRRELFDPPREPESWFKIDPTPHQIRLNSTPDSRLFSAAFPDSIMEAAGRAGISIPYSCKAGICSTCVMRCLSGAVKMRINEVLTDQDIRSGLVLTCVGYATSDLVLEFPLNTEKPNGTG